MRINSGLPRAGAGHPGALHRKIVPVCGDATVLADETDEQVACPRDVGRDGVLVVENRRDHVPGPRVHRL